MRPFVAVSQFVIVSLFAGVASTPTLHAQRASRSETIAAIDSIANEPIRAGRAAGMSVAVVRAADTLVLKGYGYADVELDAPTPDRAVYEIGSVTKQFTATAVLQLQERGLLTLDDDLTKHLPDYPTAGHRITIRRLLDHTSGIKGYTEIPSFWTTIAMRSLPRDSLVALFSSQPFDFAPGEAMIYNNSAYFLLGLIIERASGESYEEYVAKHLFEPAGMADSRYCDKQALVEHRALGYSLGQNGLQPAPYLDHTWPYAAGSLCSSAGDMIAWNRALHGHGQGGGLLSADSYRELVTPGKLNDGSTLRYAKGLVVMETGGRRVIQHGGGIFGFLSESRYYPDEDLIVVVLINTAGPVSPAGIANAIVSQVLGEPAEAPSRTYAGDLEELVGTYKGPGRGSELTVTVSHGSDGLSLAIGNGEPRPLRYADGLTFAQGSNLYTFVRDGGAVTGLRADQVAGYYVLKREK